MNFDRRACTHREYGPRRQLQHERDACAKHNPLPELPDLDAEHRVQRREAGVLGGQAVDFRAVWEDTHEHDAFYWNGRGRVGGNASGTPLARAIPLHFLQLLDFFLAVCNPDLLKCARWRSFRPKP